MDEAGQPLDVQTLRAWLTGHLPGIGPSLEARAFAGGQSNPTFLLTDGRNRWVLRKKPAGPVLPSAHAVDREFRVISALYGGPVPVARPLCLCEDDAVIGTPFYVMAHVEGRIFWDPALPGFTQPERAALHDNVNRLVAALHALDPVALGLEDYGRPGGFVRRQVARWTKQYLASETVPIPDMHWLIDWLPTRVPADSPHALVHGDLRLDNMIVHPSEPRVIALLDWELSTVGDPLADLSYHMLPWHLTAQEFRGFADKDLHALGIPSEADYLRRWCERTDHPGVDASTLGVYLVYNLFRLAAILQGIARRAQDGTAAAANAHETGARARPIAELARRLADRLDAT